MPLPPLSVENLNGESGYAVCGSQLSHNLAYRGSGPGSEVNVLRRALYKTVRLDCVSPRDGQPVPGANRQDRLHQGPMITLEHGRFITPAPVRGSAPAISRGAVAAGA